LPFAPQAGFWKSLHSSQAAGTPADRGTRADRDAPQSRAGPRAAGGTPARRVLLAASGAAAARAMAP
jgi:hypothetical protein